MQPKEEIEKSYETPDPWGYQSSPQDGYRKHMILKIVGMFAKPAADLRAIDICCGEGWITKDLPASTIHGIELSDNAAARFPANVKRVDGPIGKYDIAMATGCLYGHYNWRQVIMWLNEAVADDGIIVVSNIESWEQSEVPRLIQGQQIFEASFPYNEHRQKVRVFKQQESGPAGGPGKVGWMGGEFDR